MNREQKQKQITERVLRFTYAFGTKEEAEKMKEALKKENIGFISYESIGYWPHEFTVRRSGKKWDDVLKIVNSVHAVKYKFKRTCLGHYDGKVVEFTHIIF